MPDESHGILEETTGRIEPKSLDDALTGLNITPEEAVGILQPLISQAIEQQLNGALGEQIGATIRSIVTPYAESIPSQVQEITLAQVKPSLDELQRQAQVLMTPPQMPPEQAMYPADGQPPARGFGKLFQNPEIMDKFFEKIADKLLVTEEDPLSQVEKSAQIVQRMQGIVNAFTIPTGFNQEQMQKVALDTFMQGMRVKSAATQGGNAPASPLTLVPVEASKKPLNGHSKEPIESSDSLLSLYG